MIMTNFRISQFFLQTEKREWKLGCIRELTVAAGLRALFAEFLGTFMLVMVATGITIDSLLNPFLLISVHGIH